MIICMFRIDDELKSNTICITNRHLCEGDFLVRIESIAKSGVKAIILREKDMQDEEYEALARQVIDICRDNNTLCILHSFVQVANRLKHNSIHLPMPAFRSLSIDSRKGFEIIGASCHSVKEAVEAEGLGCTYITASHVFETDCKSGLKPRGLDFVTDVSNAVHIPVYGLGGITETNAKLVLKSGATGIGIMSGFMK